MSGLRQFCCCLFSVPVCSYAIFIDHTNRGANNHAVLQMMHKGWLLERTAWEESCRSARSVYGIGDAMVHLEDWINLDYPDNSEVALAPSYFHSQFQAFVVVFI